MPDSSYFFESGEPVQIGSHGDTSYFYHSGEPVVNSGDSTYLFESGTGVGGGLPPGVKYRWSFEESSPPYEDSVNGLLLEAAVGSPTTVSGGIDGSAVEFDGSSDGLLHGGGGNPPTGSIDLGGEWTMVVWTYQYTTNETEQIVEWIDDSNAEVRWETKNGGIEMLGDNDRGQISPQNHNTWEMYGATYSSQNDTHKAYYNDSLDFTESGNSPTDKTTTERGLYLGYDEWNNQNNKPPYQFWNGKMDELILWDRVLSEAEMNEVYTFFSG